MNSYDVDYKAKGDYPGDPLQPFRRRATIRVQAWDFGDAREKARTMAKQEIRKLGVVDIEVKVIHLRKVETK